MKVDDVVTIVAGLGGITSTGQLLERGVQPDAIRRAVAHRGLLLRPRRGIIALPSTPGKVLSAARAGGALAATSAAEFHGLWAPTDPRLHISVRPDAVASLDSRVVIHRDRHHLSAAEKFVVSRESCVRQCSRFLPFEQAVAVLDSALHQDLGGAAPQLELSRLRSALPARLQSVIEAADERAEAGAESIARVRLARVGVIARPQVRIARGIRVDLLIGDHLVVEVGSQEFHAHPDQYESDHDRAAIIVGLGFDLLEFTTLQVMDDWATVEGVILQRARPRATFNQQL